MASGSETANKALIRRWFDEVWNSSRTDLIEELRAPDIQATGLGDSGSISRGEEPFRVFYSNLKEAFPDLHIRIDDMLAEADKVAVRLTLEGTHAGQALGVHPTGNRVQFSGIVIARIQNGRIAEAWNSLDQWAILKQIGAVPNHNIRENFLTTRI